MASWDFATGFALALPYAFEITKRNRASPPLAGSGIFRPERSSERKRRTEPKDLLVSDCFVANAPRNDPSSLSLASTVFASPPSACADEGSKMSRLFSRKAGPFRLQNDMRYSTTWLWFPFFVLRPRSALRSSPFPVEDFFFKPCEEDRYTRPLRIRSLSSGSSHTVRSCCRYDSLPVLLCLR